MAGRNNFDPSKALHPGQISRTKKHIKEYAKHYCEDMVNVLYDIATDDTNYARDRIAAAEAILNRGYGRPVDANKIEADSGDIINVEKLTSAQLMNIISEYNDAEVVEQQLLPAPTPEGEAVLVASELLDRMDDA